MRRAALHNLGCKVNAYETEAMQQILEKTRDMVFRFRSRQMCMSSTPVP